MDIGEELQSAYNSANIWACLCIMHDCDLEIYQSFFMNV